MRTRRERATGLGEVSLTEQSRSVGGAGNRDICPGAADRRGAGDVEAPVLQDNVGNICFEQASGDATGLIGNERGRPRHVGATQLHRTRAPRDLTALHEVGVAVDDGDAIHRHTEPIGDEHRPGGAVTLPVRRRSGDHLDVDTLTIGRWRDLDLAEFATTGHRSDLDVDGHADSDLYRVAALPSSLLLGAQCRIVDRRHELVEPARVVAAVVGGTGPRREREAIGADEIATSYLDRIHADLEREQIHRPLDRSRGLGPPSTAVCNRRHRVGEYGLGVDVGSSDVVGAGEHDPRHER